MRIITAHQLDSENKFRNRSCEGDIRCYTLANVISLLSAPAPNNNFHSSARRLKSNDGSDAKHALESMNDYISYLNGNVSLWQPPAVPSVKLTQTQNSTFQTLPHKLYATPAGRVVRRDAYQIGAPCTFARAPQASDQRVVRLAVSSSANFHTTDTEMARYASGIFAVLNAIVKLGVAFEVAVYRIRQPLAVLYDRNKYKPVIQVIWLKRANDCVNKHRLNALVVCPDANRRLMFDLTERDGKQISNGKVVGLAHATLDQQRWFNEQFDLVLPTLPELGPDPQKLINWVIDNWKLGAQNA